jgi:hypothetical protein
MGSSRTPATNKQ